MPTETKPEGLAGTDRLELGDDWRGDAEAPAEAPERDEYSESVYTHLKEWVHQHYGDSEGARKYLANALIHMRRYVTSLHWIPVGAGRLLDPAPGDGCFPEIVRKFRRCEVDVPAAFFDLEREPAPYPDDTFDGVVLMEVLEHFKVDPMHCMVELNRILKPGGFLFLTTPNLASWVSLHNLINYHTPYIYGLFERDPNPDRHNREYTVMEVGRMAEAAGFYIENLEGITVYAEHDCVAPIPGVKAYNRGDTTFLLARKTGPVKDRYPDWLYGNWH